MSLLSKVRAAAEWGLLWGIKLALAVGLVVLSVAYLLNDYGIVRQRAQNGQAAFEFLQQQLAAQQKASAPPIAPKGP